MRRAILLLAGLLLGAQSAHALQFQVPDVLIVDDDGGPGVDFTDLPEAIEALEGDGLIVVKRGNYSGFTLDHESARVVAAGDGPVSISGTVSIRELNGAQQFLLRGISSPPNGPPLEINLFQNLGRVLIEDCVAGPLEGNTSGQPGLRSNGDTSVAIVRCEIRGGTSLPQPGGGGGVGLPGMSTFASNIWCYQSVFRGGDAIVAGADGGAGIDHFNFELFLAECEMHGGRGGDGSGCGDGGQGGNGLNQLGFVSNLRQRASRGFGGDGGAPGCPTAEPGADGQGLFVDPGANTVTNLGSQRRGFHAGPPVGPNEPQTLHFDAPTAEYVVVFASSLQGISQITAAGGVGLLQGPEGMLYRGPVPEGGVLTIPVAAGVLPPGLESLTLYLQALFVPPARRPVLGPASAAVWLAD